MALVSILVYVLVALDGGAGAVVLVVINNIGYVIVFFSSPEDDEVARYAIVVSAVVDGSGAVFLIVVVDEGAGAVVVAITGTVVSWSSFIVTVLAVGDRVVVAYFIIISVDIIEIETIVLDNGAGTVVAAVVVDDDGAGAAESTHPAFSWDRGRMNKLVYWFMGGE